MLPSYSSEGAINGSSHQGQVSTESISQLVGGCPHVVVQMGGVDVKCLVDTGSMVSTVTETFFCQNLRGSPNACQWLQLTAANGLAIPYLGYVELDVKVLGRVISKRGILIVKDQQNSLPSTDVPGILGMNILSECYHELFVEYGPALFTLSQVTQAPEVLQQALQYCHKAQEQPTN